jgi:ABC-type dipeptide/oligopeptide/nickel transport system permease subunit
MWLVSDTAKDATEPADDGDIEFSEAIDSAAVQRDQASAPWGTDGAGHSVREWMGRGATSYILYGLVASFIGMLGGLGFALMTEWFTRPAIPLPHKPSAVRRHIKGVGRATLETVDSIPKFLLVLAIFAAGHLSITKFSIGMGIFLMFGTAALFRERTASFLASEQYLYALEIGLHPARILFVHLVRRQLVPLLLVQLPFMLSTFIMWEATMSFINFQALNTSWGDLIKNSYDTGGYLFWIPMVSLLFVVSSLYLLGDAVKERIEPEA